MEYAVWHTVCNLYGFAATQVKCVVCRLMVSAERPSWRRRVTTRRSVRPRRWHSSVWAQASHADLDPAAQRAEVNKAPSNRCLGAELAHGRLLRAAATAALRHLNNYHHWCSDCSRAHCTVPAVQALQSLCCMAGGSLYSKLSPARRRNTLPL